LFRNQDADWVNQTARQADLDYLQLCGDENCEYMDRRELPVLKQVRVRKGTTPEKLAGMVSPFLASNRSVVLDRYDRDTPGGSGRTFDWAAAEGVANLDNVLLAGGINPENVGSAINQLSPWGIDVSTGVETDGMKDPVRIRAFIDAVRNA
jgi:phosphoribosylanthranilate isomerase